MNPILQADLALVTDALASQGITVRFQPFGSARDGKPRDTQDIDVAVIVNPAHKSRAVNVLRDLATTGARQMNWRIDIFDAVKPGHGYNSRIHAGWLHWLVISRHEADGPTPLAANIRRAGSQTPHP